ncbi:hypothetical protein [Umezawaea sp. NPDC059074]|uniref:hypothetical protein n=1 Tax=Umezawaea sp. NPDC059074 TaxID=3346716 RepID=UPI0036C5BC08
MDAAREAFTWLVTGPNPVSVNGRQFPDLPNRPIPLDELRDRLLTSGCSRTTRDAVWAHLVQRARAEGATWTVAAVGVALPALISAAATLSDRFAGDPADVHSEVLRGFLTALPIIDLRPPRIVLRLRWAAYRTGYNALTEALASPTPVAASVRSAWPYPPSGHPDLVLARAVASGVLTRTEADLIGATRLEGVAVADWAAHHETGEWAVYKTRKRAELRLLAHLREEVANEDPTDPLVDRIAASLSLARGVDRVTQSGNSSPFVPADEADPKWKVRGRVSKSDAKSGVQGCGDNPPSARTSEEFPCA